MLINVTIIIPVYNEENTITELLSKIEEIKNINKQIIIVDDGSIDKSFKKMEKSSLIGEILAKRAKEKNISKVYFDRGEYKYHGRIKAFADTLRKNGLKF